MRHNMDDIEIFTSRQMRGHLARHRPLGRQQDSVHLWPQPFNNDVDVRNRRINEQEFGFEIHWLAPVQKNSVKKLKNSDLFLKIWSEIHRHFKSHILD